MRTPRRSVRPISRLSPALAVAGVVVATLWSHAPPAQARPTGPQIFCQTYPDSPFCAGTSATCNMCHTSTTPGAAGWNPYGIALIVALGGAEFDAGLPTALPAIEDDDADGDGVSNIDEITYGSRPYDAMSVEVAPWVPFGPPNPKYVLDGYDHAFAFRRVAIAFCGRSPTYADTQAFNAAADKAKAVHDKLEACLQSTYWTERMLPRLADPKIRPIDRFEMWVWDYQLFRWALTGDRDARDLILADYHVVTNAEGNLQVVTGVIPPFNATVCNDDSGCEAWERCFDPNGQDADPTKYCGPIDGAQPLDPSLRAGLLTTNWFHFYNTMFSALPRQTASQAYRAYADLDIARQQGLYPTDSYGALDVDQKGILQEECWQCHSTLERLSYPFATHYGIGGGASSQYDENRPVNLGLWGSTAEQPVGVIFGQEVNTVREWAQVLADSEEFSRMVTRMFWQHAIGRDPKLEENDEFTALWKVFPDLGYNAQALLHAMVDTLAFGAP